MRDDIERLAPKGLKASGTTDAARKVALDLAAMVSDDEVVHAICWVNWGRKTVFDILALTDRRLILLGKGVIRSESEDYPLSQVSSISAFKKLISTELTFIVGGTSRSVKAFEPPKADGLVRKARELMSRPASAAPAPPSTPDPLAQLKELAALRDAGVLTDQEFEEKKKDLLSRI